MSYIDRKRYDYEPRPMVRTRTSRWSFLGVALCFFATPLAKAAKEHGWVVSSTAAQIVVGALGLGCIFGAWIAYRMTQRQVVRDFEEVRNAGKGPR